MKCVAFVDGLPFDSIGEAEANWLEREFDEREVLEVVKAMNGVRVPSIDGYSMVFFQACWDVLKENIMKVFREFHARGKFERSLNATFIALIPKILWAVDLKDFHPISLMSGIYNFLFFIFFYKKPISLKKRKTPLSTLGVYKETPNLKEKSE
jgi:hypothetical protein